ncbi:hypothetical protein AAOGI_19510 [Agarivorans albus]
MEYIIGKSTKRDLALTDRYIAPFIKVCDANGIATRTSINRMFIHLKYFAVNATYDKFWEFPTPPRLA